MGRNHARIYAEHEDVDLVAVVDYKERTAREMSTKYECLGYLSLSVMLDRLDIDIASVVSPTVYHYDHAIRLLNAGVSVLIEKPLARTIDEADALVDRASHPNVVVAVGHIERCNPGIRAAKRLIDKGLIGEIYRVSTCRVGPSPMRIRDVGVTLDLATHDLDIARYITGKDPIEYSAMIQRRRHNGLDDSLNALVKLEDNVIAVIECDWLTPAKHRWLSVVGSKGSVFVDYMTQEFTVMTEPECPWSYDIEWGEPLKIEIEEFIDAVRGNGRPAASAYDGLMAVKMAHRLLEVADE